MVSKNLYYVMMFQLFTFLRSAFYLSREKSSSKYLSNVLRASFKVCQRVRNHSKERENSNFFQNSEFRVINHSSARSFLIRRTIQENEVNFLYDFCMACSFNYLYLSLSDFQSQHPSSFYLSILECYYFFFVVECNKRKG